MFLKELLKGEDSSGGMHPVAFGPIFPDLYGNTTAVATVVTSRI